MARHGAETVIGGRRRRPWGILLTTGVLAAFVIGIVSYSLSSDDFRPHYRQQVSMPGMNDHFLNLWTDPNPPSMGRVDLTAQITDVTGFSVRPSTLVFRVSRQGDSGALEVPGAFDRSGPGRGQVFRASAELDASGPWQVVVAFTMSGMMDEVTFPIEVRD